MRHRSSWYTATSGRDVPCHCTGRTGDKLPILQGVNCESVNLIFQSVKFDPDRLYDGLQAT